MNVLAWPNLIVEGIFEAGAQRISFGSWLWSVAKRLGFERAMEVAAEIRDNGDLSALTQRGRLMQRSGVPDWGSIGRTAVLSSLVGAVVTFFVLPDQRWIAAIFVGSRALRRA